MARIKNVNGVAVRDCPATPVFIEGGEAGDLAAGIKLTVCRCDDVNGDKTEIVSYVRVVSIADDGTVTVVGEYLPDFSAAYTPVNPIDCDDIGEDAFLQPLELCDAVGTFWRIIDLISGTTIREMDANGNTYTPVGNVGSCKTAGDEVNPIVDETCYEAEGTPGADPTCNGDLERILYNEAPNWDAGNPDLATQETELFAGNTVVVENTQNKGVQSSVSLPVRDALLGVNFGTESWRLEIDNTGEVASLRIAFDEPVCIRLSTRAYNNMPIVITSDAIIDAHHNTDDPPTQGSAPIVTDNLTNAVTVESADSSRVAVLMENATFFEFAVTNNRANPDFMFIGTYLDLTTPGVPAVPGETYKQITYQDGTVVIFNVNDPADQPDAVDPAWTEVPCQNADAGNGPVLFLFDADGVAWTPADIPAGTLTDISIVVLTADAANSITDAAGTVVTNLPQGFSAEWAAAPQVIDPGAGRILVSMQVS